MREGYSTWSVCLRVYVFLSGTSYNQVYKQQYQRLQRDTGMKYKKGIFLKHFIPKLWRHLLTVTVPGDIQAPFSYPFQRWSILKLFKRPTVGYALPETPLDIRQNARVLWQSLSLLSQCSEQSCIISVLLAWYPAGTARIYGRRVHPTHLLPIAC